MTQKELLARIDERQQQMNNQLTHIFNEVKKTNGRVTALENWKSRLQGSWKAVVVLSVAIGGVIGWITNLIF